jgi:hypothetical protein
MTQAHARGFGRATAKATEAELLSTLKRLRLTPRKVA